MKAFNLSLCASLLATSLLGAQVGDVMAQGPAGIASNEDEKDLRVRVAPREDLQVSLKVMNRPRVGEKVQFRIRGNDDFYLYMYTVSERTGRAYLVLPNAIQKANKYSGGMYHNVPNANVEIYADNAGYEKVFFVASRKYIDWDVRDYKQIGDFYELSADELEADVSKQISLSRPMRERPPRASARNDYRDQNRDYDYSRYTGQDAFIGELDFFVRR